MNNQIITNIPFKDRLFIFDLDTYSIESATCLYKPVRVYSATLYYQAIYGSNPLWSKKTFVSNPQHSASELALQFAIDTYNKILREYINNNLIHFRDEYKLPNAHVDSLMNIYKRNNPLALCAHKKIFDIMLHCKNIIKTERSTDTMSNIEAIKLTWSNNSSKTPEIINIQNIMSFLPTSLTNLGITIPDIPYPHSFYNQKFCENQIANSWKNPWVSIDDFCKTVNRDQLLSFVQELKNIYNEETCMINSLEYCKYYNELEIEIIASGIYQFWNLIHEILPVVSEKVLDISGYAHGIIALNGAYRDIPLLSKSLSKLIRAELTRNITFLQDNRPRIINQQLLNFKINNLLSYCSTMELPLGPPCNVDPNLFTADKIHEVNKFPAYIATFSVHRIPVSKSISYISYKCKDGDTFLQQIPDGVSKITLMGTKQTFELLTIHQGLKYGTLEEGGDFIITSAYSFAYKDGTLRSIIENLYSRSQQEHDNGNESLSNCIKLLLDSVYKKTCQEKHNSDIATFRDNIEAVYYIEDKEYEGLLMIHKSISTDHGDVISVESLKTLTSTYINRSHVTLHIIEYAKLILAQHHKCLQEAGMEVIYSDIKNIFVTDISQDKIERYRALYQQNYGRDPIALNDRGHDILGNVKLDYQLPNDIIPSHEQIISKECDYGIFVMPYVYMYSIRVTTASNTYHYPVAKIGNMTHEAIKATASNGRYHSPDENGRCNRIIYRHLAEKDKEEKVAFNRLIGNRISVKYIDNCYYYNKYAIDNI